MLLATAVVVALASLAPSLASAVTVATNTCSVNLLDSVGGTWDLNADGVDGAVDDGSLQPEGRSDAYDVFPVLNLSGDGSTWTRYVDSDPNAFGNCTSEDNGREIVTPVLNINGLDVYRKSYVPQSGLAFARFLNVLTNPTSDPITVSIDLAGGRTETSNNGDLGSDELTMVTGSSSGDAATVAGDVSQMTTDDNWATTADDPTNPDDPTLAHVWQDRVNGTDQADQVGTTNATPESLLWQFDNVTVQPGQTVIYASFEAMRRTIQESIDAANAIAAEPAELWAGMSDTELLQVQNFGDFDRDGVANQADNCPRTPNADQSDIDHDGTGDACDNDIDGDGLSNTSEAEFGTDPRNPDTDGDGVGDKADVCPRTAGKGSDGCPVAETTQAPKDTTPPNAQITSVSSAKNLTDLLNGIDVTLTCDEACEANVRALGRMPTGSAVLSVTGGFNRVLGRTYSTFKSGSRTVRVRPCEPKPGAKQSVACLKRLRKAGSAKRSFLVKVLVLATDRSGNTKETSKLVRVRRG
jgi:hypothetical protein